MHKVINNETYVLIGRKLPFLNDFIVKKTFRGEEELIGYLCKVYDSERGFWFDGRVYTGETMDKSYFFGRLIGKNNETEIFSPYRYKNKVLNRVETIKKQTSTYRRAPVPRTGKRSVYRSGLKRIKHTAWYRESKIRQTIDKEWGVKRESVPQFKYEDWYAYHTHKINEGKSWKNKKIRRQWMKNLK